MSYNITANPSLSPQTQGAILKYLTTFYQTSDTESAHDQYVASFTDDATLIMGPRKTVGSEQIRALRHAIWVHVASRKHTPQKVFFGADNEAMLYGTVGYVLKADEEKKVIEVPWGARAVFEVNGEDVKMSFYQVYLDTGAQSGK